MGVPADYTPAGQPPILGGSTALPPNAPANTNVATYWDTNHPSNPGSGREHQRPECALFGVETDSWRKTV
jgi:hypothetical protein